MIAGDVDHPVHLDIEAILQNQGAEELWMPGSRRADDRLAGARQTGWFGEAVADQLECLGGGIHPMAGCALIAEGDTQGRQLTDQFLAVRADGGIHLSQCAHDLESFA